MLLTSQGQIVWLAAVCKAVCTMQPDVSRLGYVYIQVVLQVNLSVVNCRRAWRWEKGASSKPDQHWQWCSASVPIFCCQRRPKVWWYSIDWAPVLPGLEDSGLFSTYSGVLAQRIWRQAVWQSSECCASSSASMCTFCSQASCLSLLLINFISMHFSA